MRREFVFTADTGRF